MATGTPQEVWNISNVVMDVFGIGYKASDATLTAPLASLVGSGPATPLSQRALKAFEMARESMPVQLQALRLMGESRGIDMSPLTELGVTWNALWRKHRSATQAAKHFAQFFPVDSTSAAFTKSMVRLRDRAQVDEGGDARTVPSQGKYRPKKSRTGRRGVTERPRLKTPVGKRQKRKPTQRRPPRNTDAPAPLKPVELLNRMQMRHAPIRTDGAVDRPEFHLTTDLRATSDPLWQALATFRQRVMHGGTWTFVEWRTVLLDIREGAYEAGLRPDYGSVKWVTATVDEVHEGYPDGGWDERPKGQYQIVLLDCGKLGSVHQHDVLDGFADTGEPWKSGRRASAIRWAEGWMSARERQLTESAGSTVAAEVVAAVKAQLATIGIAHPAATHPVRPVNVADAARAANLRSDVLLRRIRARKHAVGGVKGASTAEHEHILASLPDNKKKQYRKWADEHCPAE